MESSSTLTMAGLMMSLREFLAGWLALRIDNGWLSVMLLAAATLVAIGGYYLSIVILRMVAAIVEKTETDWDDDLINAPLLRAISMLTPAIIGVWLFPMCFYRDSVLSSAIHLVTAFYVIWVTVYAANTFLDNLFTAFSKRARFRPYAVKGIFQMVKLIFISIGVIIALSLIVGKSPIAILTALGASAAVLMLVFRDTILGLVASVQLTANKMVRRGDWVIVPKHGANGEVMEISLTTVKIRNWDNSVTTVPPYSLVSDSFQNFQAMRRTGARRVCRAVLVDLDCVRYLDVEEIALIKSQLGFAPDDEEENESGASRINLSLFRDYLEDWLSKHPEVRNDLIYMVRQLEPTPTGLPLELYFFLSVTDWKRFEHLQSDIFNHLYAVAPLFAIQLFQSPTGKDLRPRSPHQK